MIKEQRISIKESPQKRELPIQTLPIPDDVSVERNTISDRERETSSKKADINQNVKNDTHYVNEIFLEELF